MSEQENGKILMEQVFGIKNFIHDFSLLSEKEKEEVMLWNEFLIYAIVLEENSIIINEISKKFEMNNIFSKINEFIGTI